MAHDYKTQGKRNRRKGGDWEREVRADLESEGWIVVKFANQINLDYDGDKLFEGRFVLAKSYYNPRRKGFMMGAGFPDLIVFEKSPKGEKHKIRFVECKINGTLGKEEKEKMAWLESEGYECFVAGKDVNGNVEYSKPKKTLAMIKLEKENE